MVAPTIRRRGHEGRLRVEPGGSIAASRTAGFGAQQAFSRGGARVSNAPIPDFAKRRWAWRVRSLADIRHAGRILLTGNTWSLVPIAV